MSSWVIPYFEVFDMTASLEFYRDMLGFEVVFASPEVTTPEGRFSHFMRLRLRDVEIFLNTAYDSGERPAVRDDARWEGHRDVGLYIDHSDVDRLYRTLRERGLDIEPPRVQWAMNTIHMRDPDGYALTFQTPVDA